LAPAGYEPICPANRILTQAYFTNGNRRESRGRFGVLALPDNFWFNRHRQLKTKTRKHSTNKFAASAAVRHETRNS